MRTRLLLASLALSALACAPLADKGVGEEDAPVDGAYDSFRSPTDHGLLAFGVQGQGTLTAAEGFHSWTFSLSGPASVALRTERTATSTRDVDTVLYLYREGATGWGRALTSNDDSMGSLFSAISRNLEAGRYRIIVKGYQRSTRGPFGVVAECTGAGCGTPITECLFPGVFGQLSESLRLNSWSNTFSNAAEFTGFPVLSSQLIRAMNASGHPEVTTVEAALALTPEHVAERFEIYDQPGARAFTAWRFVLGDHYFGAIFAAGTTTVVGRIVDNVVESCTVGFEQCMLGASYRAFSMGTELEAVSDQTITTVTGLAPARAAQLLRAVQEAFEEVTTPAAALAAVQDATVNVVTRRDAATGRTFVGYEYGAGDNSYGAIFEGDSATPVGEINDGDLYGCTAFRAPPPPSLAGEDCSRAALCAEELVCMGVAEEEGIGRCVSFADVPGNEASCSATTPCMAGLVCTGITRGPEGICRPEWVRGTFTSSTRVAIPDGNATGVSSGVLVYGLATVDTDVEVTARFTHARSTDLRISLVNYAGTEQPVFDGSTSPVLPSPFTITRTVAGSGDESVTGNWYLRVIDTRRGTSGRLDGYSLTVTTRMD